MLSCYIISPKTITLNVKLTQNTQDTRSIITESNLTRYCNIHKTLSIINVYTNRQVMKTQCFHLYETLEVSETYSCIIYCTVNFMKMTSAVNSLAACCI